MYNIAADYPVQPIYVVCVKQVYTDTGSKMITGIQGWVRHNVQ